MAYFRKIDAKNKQGFKWICTKDGPADPVTGKRNQISRRADGKKEAEALCDEAIRKLTDHGIDDKKIKNLPFENVAWEWLDTYSRGKRKESTVYVRETQIKVILRYYAKTSIDKVTSRMHQMMLNDLDDKGYGKMTIEGVHVTAGMIFKYAVKEKMRIDNPCVGAVIPTKKLTVEEIENNTIDEKYLEHDELDEFLNVVRNHGLQYDLERFYLLAFSGMRSGELCALKWSDVNFETNEIRITKTIYNPKSKRDAYQLTPPKTPGSVRTIEIDESVMKMLKKHKVRQAEKRLRNRNQDYHNGDFIFCRKDGYPFVQKSVYNRMERILKKTSIKKHATPHIFRHTHISMLAEAGVDIATIMNRVGHEDIKTTTNIYTHVTKKMKKDASDRIKFQFENILRPINLQ